MRRLEKKSKEENYSHTATQQNGNRTLYHLDQPLGFVRNKYSLIFYEAYCPGELFFVPTEDTGYLSTRMLKTVLYKSITVNKLLLLRMDISNMLSYEEQGVEKQQCYLLL